MQRAIVSSSGSRVVDVILRILLRQLDSSNCVACSFDPAGAMHDRIGALTVGLFENERLINTHYHAQCTKITILQRRTGLQTYMILGGRVVLLRRPSTLTVVVVMVMAGRQGWGRGWTRR